MDLLPVAIDAAGGAVLTSTRASISNTGDTMILPSTEGSARQHGRGIAQAVNAADLNKPPQEEEHLPGDASHAFLPGLRSPVAADAQGDFGAPSSPDIGKNKGLYDPNDIRGMAKRRWAMTIDLARCTGCSACVTACYAENNIPTVGAFWQNATFFADQKPGLNIARGREMNWIRLERYFEGNPDGKFGVDFETRFVPMLCQHCGNAPCEPVCPVYATYHSPDGLNVQVYNRCVGTRYCSNNCPYKVRRFNYFAFAEEEARPPISRNPDVSVRGRGVMEKCTFCIQRIAQARIASDRDGGPEQVVTACQAACPTQAFSFGDINDPSTEVVKRKHSPLNFVLLPEQATRPRVTYEGRILNRNPAIPL
jgi:molybdopterin-containing oxidoreductase family iron-sulfur binding subunit